MSSNLTQLREMHDEKFRQRNKHFLDLVHLMSPEATVAPAYVAVMFQKNKENEFKELVYHGRDTGEPIQGSQVFEHFTVMYVHLGDRSLIGHLDKVATKDAASLQAWKASLPPGCVAMKVFFHDNDMAPPPTSSSHPPAKVSG